MPPVCRLFGLFPIFGRAQKRISLAQTLLTFRPSERARLESRCDNVCYCSAPRPPCYTATVHTQTTHTNLFAPYFTGTFSASPGRPTAAATTAPTVSSPPTFHRVHRTCNDGVARCVQGRPANTPCASLHQKRTRGGVTGAWKKDTTSCLMSSFQFGASSMQICHVGLSGIFLRRAMGPSCCVGWWVLANMVWCN